MQETEIGAQRCELLNLKHHGKTYLILSNKVNTAVKSDGMSTL
jgi:hypothetical protein